MPGGAARAMVRSLIQLCRALMRRFLPPSRSTVSTSCVVTSVFSDSVAVGRPELAGWRALRRPEVAKAVNYELIGYLEVSRGSTSGCSLIRYGHTGLPRVVAYVWLARLLIRERASFATGVGPVGSYFEEPRCSNYN